MLFDVWQHWLPCLAQHSKVVMMCPAVTFIMTVLERLSFDVVVIYWHWWLVSHHALCCLSVCLHSISCSFDIKADQLINWACLVVMGVHVLANAAGNHVKFAIKVLLAYEKHFCFLESRGPYENKIRPIISFLGLLAL